MKKKILTLLVLLMTAVTGAVAQGYYLVGTMNGWTPDSKYKLTENTANPGEYMITLLLEPTSQFKVAYSEDGTTVKYWYPSDGPNYGEGGQITEDDRYTVYFKPGTGGDDWYYNCIYVVSDPLYATPTGNKNEWTLDMPDYDVELEVEYETALALAETTDNSAALTEWNSYEADVTLTRTLQAGGWNTFCVPFSMDIPSGWTVKELTSSSLSGETLTLNFDDAESIVAGTPYLVRVTDAVANPTFDGVIISKTAQPTVTTYANFVPVFSPTNLQGGNTNILFITGGNTLTYPSANGNINGFRAYFLLHDASAARSFSLNLGDKETGIMAIDHSPLNTDQSVYDLQGRRMANGQSSTVNGQSLKKGVYIVNGKKTVIK